MPLTNGTKTCFPHPTNKAVGKKHHENIGNVDGSHTSSIGLCEVGNQFPKEDSWPKGKGGGRELSAKEWFESLLLLGSDYLS